MKKRVGENGSKRLARPAPVGNRETDALRPLQCVSQEDEIEDINSAVAVDIGPDVGVCRTLAEIVTDEQEITLIQYAINVRIELGNG